MGTPPHPLSIHIHHLHLQQHLFHHQPHQSSWLVPSRLPASPLVARPPVSSSPPRPLASPPRLPVVSRSLTATSLVPSLSVRSVATRSRPSSSSASSPSSVWSVRSPRTPTCAPSTPSVSPSRARTSSSPAVSAVSALKRLALDTHNNTT